MSEAIAEMILPGTYIEVRAEGLIGVGGISTGNIGVVGTATRGPLNKVVILGTYSEAVDTFGAYDRWPGTDVAPAVTLTRTLEQVFKGGGSTIYAVRVANLAAGVTMKPMSWVLADDGGTLFTLTATSPGTWANIIKATLQVPTTGPATIQLEYNRLKETFTGATADDLVKAINSGSRLVSVNDLADANKAKVPKTLTAASGGNMGGPDGVAATKTEIATGLDLLANQSVNIVAIGGFDAKTIGGTVLAHLEATENDGRERIAVLGVSGDNLTDITNDVAVASNPRLVLVAPGIVADDASRAGETNKSVNLTAPYAAAVVAGRMATLAPHVSLTNKDVAVDDLTRDYTRAEQKQLLGQRVLVLQKNLGIRVLKGITTDSGAFTQISVRRIVDYAKAGVRIGSNPYIGRLNNSRVRSALRATLDGFLSGMVLDEMLIGYKLDVTATRAQEITGQAIVTMVLQPTFSIDFIKVIMNLE
ncbi:MAG: phage tail sheath subtilisin-like domain-containing protein [Acidobacteriota bacterium]|nr:phage tail sheath subtilisin-like domain-containing protein [Acidobacteriota bacterium]